MNSIQLWTKELIGLIETYRSWSGAVTKHSVIKGNNREFFIRNILSRFLPKTLAVGTGQIIDTDDNISNQIDVVISDGSFPTLTSLTTSDIYFAESILATIEIKSHLKGGKRNSLWQSLENCRSVQRLEFNIPLPPESDFYNYRREIPATYVLGLQGYKSNLSSMKECLFMFISQENPTYFELPNLIISEGIVAIKNTFDIMKSNKLKCEDGMDCLYAVKQDEETLSWLLFHLIFKLLSFKVKKDEVISYFRKEFDPSEWETWGKFDKKGNKIII